MAQLLLLQIGNYYFPLMKKYQLGEFEEIVMLTVGILYKDAYGVSIKKEIESRLSRNVSVGALQTALKRLEDKGYLKSHDGEATEERAGRPKKYFQITAYGKKAMEYTRSTRDELWSAIPKVALNPIRIVS
jgi:PadR family transcriptional regulator PadR